MIKNKTILIFGSSGFIGQELVNKLKTNNYLILPKIKSKNKIYTKINSFEKDELQKVFKKKINLIINLHAQTDISLSNIKPEYDFYHNCKIIYSFIDYFKDKKNKPFFLNIGTATQLGYTNNKKPIKNNYIGYPETIFDLHKQHSENLLAFAKNNLGFSCTTLRLTNVYGFGKTHSSNRGVFLKIIQGAIKENVIKLYGGGRYIRDFIYLDDVIEGIIKACQHNSKLNDNYYYLCSGKGYSIYDFALIVKKYLKNKKSYKVKILKTKWPNHVKKIDKRSFIGSNKKFFNITGFRAEITLSRGIEKIIDGLLKK